MHTCIALDAMGGDQGLEVVVPAALLALKEDHKLRLLLVGQETPLRAKLASLGTYDQSRLELVPASQVVYMDEPPAEAMRKKRDSSMRVCLNLVKEGRAQACVSAGNTGALMATARFVLKTITGVDRPAIIAPLPTLKGFVHMLDLGANAECSPHHLVQFAVMASVLVGALHHKPKPSLGLLNIGAESIKGSELIKQTHLRLQQLTMLNYHGFVEGDDIYKGDVDIVVCDGFVGNVALKTSEGLSRLIFNQLRQELQPWTRRLGAWLLKPALKGLFQRFDPAKYNGASLLGLQGIVIKSHGNASISAFHTAIKAAQLEVRHQLLAQISDEIAATLSQEIAL